MIDYTFFGYGVALPLLGYVCGVSLSLVIRALRSGETI